MKTYGGGGIALGFLNLGARSRWVSVTRPLYSHRKSTWYALDRKLGRPQSRSGGGGEERTSMPPSGIESRYSIS